MSLGYRRYSPRRLFSRWSLDSDQQELIQGSVTTLILKFGGLFISYLFNFFLARWYGAATLGIYTLAVTLVTVFALFGQVGTQNAIIRFISEYRSRGDSHSMRQAYRKTLLIVLPLSSLSAAALFASSSSLANQVFHDPNLTRPFQIAAVAVPFASLLAINASALRGLKRMFDSYFFHSVFMPGVNVVGLIFATYFISRLYVVPVWIYVGTVVLGSIVSTLIWLGRSGSKDSVVGDVDIHLWDILRTSLPMFISAAMLFILGWTDIIMLGIFMTTADVGIYKIALKLAMLTSVSLMAVNSIVAPKFSELYWKGENNRIRYVARLSAKLIFWLSMPVLVIFIFFANPILGIFGEEFKIASISLVVLSIGQLVNAGCGSVGFLLDMTGHQKSFRNVVIAGALLNIVMNAILIPIMGIVGAAIATATSTILWNIAASIKVYHLFAFWIGYKPSIFERKENGRKVT